MTKFLTTLEKIQENHKVHASKMGMGERGLVTRGKAPDKIPDPTTMLLQSILDAVTRLDQFVRQELSRNIRHRSYEGESVKKSDILEIEEK